jgi:cytochrome P450 family 109
MDKRLQELWLGKAFSETEFINSVSISQTEPFEKNPFGHYVVSDYNLVKEIFGDTKRFLPHNITDHVKAIKEKYDSSLQPLVDGLQSWILFLHGEKYLEYRKILMKSVYEMDLKSIIDEEAVNIVALNRNKESFDIIEDFVEPFITSIMNRIANIPTEHGSLLREFASILNSIYEPNINLHDLQTLNKSSNELNDFLLNQANPYGAEETNYFWNELTKEFGEERWGELFSLVEFFLIAGIDTSVNLTGRVLNYLAKHENIRNQIELMNAEQLDIAIEELIRYLGSVNFVVRKTVADFEFKGYSLKKDDRVYLAVNSANFTEKIFSTPKELNLTRQPNPHLSFGYSLHFCVGAKLSRMELQAIIPAFITNFKNFAIKPETETFLTRSILRGVKSSILERR